MHSILSVSSIYIKYVLYFQQFSHPSQVCSSRLQHLQSQNPFCAARAGAVLIQKNRSPGIVSAVFTRLKLSILIFWRIQKNRSSGIVSAVFTRLKLSILVFWGIQKNRSSGIVSAVFTRLKLDFRVQKYFSKQYFCCFRVPLQVGGY